MDKIVMQIVQIYILKKNFVGMRKSIEDPNLHMDGNIGVMSWNIVFHTYFGQLSNNSKLKRKYAPELIQFVT